ncbi:MAG TPA: kinase [Stellaceae bacterium]|nr:kinase [Stellaceae bacterium]
MIITSTPYRISFFGGGTDYPDWFRQHGGAVLAASINRYCHLSCRFYPPFFEHKHRIVWSRIELVKETGEIAHPAVREAVRYLGVEEGLEIHHDGDLPARAGLGSSSAFAVGILHSLYALKGMLVSKQQLAREAIHLEQKLLHEDVGVQDQITTAFGGLNLIEIDRNGGFEVRPMPISLLRKRELEDNLMLVYTGIARTASDVAKQQIAAIPAQTEALHRMRELVSRASDILVSGRDLAGFGELLHEGWLLKRGLTPAISTPLIDELYDDARRAGAVGGKLLGAGGGGFVLLFVRPRDRQKVLDALKRYLMVPFEFESSGTHIVLYEPERYSRFARSHRDFVR